MTGTRRLPGGYERYDERERQQASYARPSHGDGRYGGDAPRAESRPAYPDNSTGRNAGYGDRPASYGESRPTSYERPSSYGDERRDRCDLLSTKYAPVMPPKCSRSGQCEWLA